MANDRTRWGIGRIALMAQLDAIKADLQTGLPLTAIYASRKTKLGGVGYSAFCKLVSRYAADDRPRPSSAASPSPKLEDKASARKRDNDIGFDGSVSTDSPEYRQLLRKR